MLKIKEKDLLIEVSGTEKVFPGNQLIIEIDDRKIKIKNLVSKNTDDADNDEDEKETQENCNGNQEEDPERADSKNESDIQEGPDGQEDQDVQMINKLKSKKKDVVVDAKADSGNDVLEDQKEHKEKKKVEYDKPKGQKKFSDMKLFEDLLWKICKLRRFPMTNEIQDDKDLASYFTYYNRFGNITNIIDKLGLKIKKNKITDSMKETLELFCADCDQDPEKCQSTQWQCIVKGSRKHRKSKPKAAKITTQVNS